MSAASEIIARLGKLIDVDGVLRPTTNAKGQPIHPTEEGIRNFWRWFGQSKAVDAEGRPMVLYHGTDRDFLEFKNRHANDVKGGWDMTTSRSEYANAHVLGHENANVMPVYVRSTDPVDVSFLKPTGKEGSEKFISILKNRYGIDASGFDNPVEPLGTIYQTVNNRWSRGDLRRELTDYGIDSIRMPDTQGGIDAETFVTFEPTQIKSAAGNRGTFSPTDPRITYGAAGAAVLAGAAAPDPSRPAEAATVTDLRDYRHPYWAGLASRTEQAQGLPSGMLAAVLAAEASNADQVSPKGARTPFQITPATRDRALAKWGIDAYLSPENAAEVAGRLLGDSLARNRGDRDLALAEYHGGTDRAGWGPRTEDYVRRASATMRGGAAPAAPQGPAPATAPSPAPAPATAADLTPQQVRQLWDAYQSGAMTAEEAAEYEADARALRVPTPDGAVLKGMTPSALAAPAQAPAQAPTQAAPQGAPGPEVLPVSIAQAYANGAMTRDEMMELEADVRAGRYALPEGYGLQKTEPLGILGGIRSAITGYDRDTPETRAAQDWTAMPELREFWSLPVARTALGTLMAGPEETARVIQSNFPQVQARQDTKGNWLFRSAIDGKEYAYQPGLQWSDAPRVGTVAAAFTPAGRVATAAGEMLAGGAVKAGFKEAAKAGLAGAATAAAVEGTQAGTGGEFNPDQIAWEAGLGTGAAMLPGVPAAIGYGWKSARRFVSGLHGSGAGSPLPPGAPPSAGAAGVGAETVRRESAGGLPVPMRLTQGEASRDPMQLKFEKESAKLDIGAPLREHYAEHDLQVAQNIDAFLDQTGSTLPDDQWRRALGVAVDDALVAKAGRRKAEIRAAYAAADKAGETAALVPADPVVEVLNKYRSAESTAPVLAAARREIQRLKGAADDGDGALAAGELSVADMEQLRKFINYTTGTDAPDRYFARELKAAIDEATEDAGGDLYKKARALRRRYAEEMEDRAVVADLLTNKRGSPGDRRVALEDVFDRVILRGSLDDMRWLRRVLQTRGGGAEGQQAWREMQGAGLQWIKEQATRMARTNQDGNREISAAGFDRAIKRLEADGKIDFLFGKQGAEQLRLLRDVVMDVFTTPTASAINNSNTAATLAAGMDMIVSASSGVPAPLMSVFRLLRDHVKNNKLKARIADALRQPAP